MSIQHRHHCETVVRDATETYNVESDPRKNRIRLTRPRRSKLSLARKRSSASLLSSVFILLPSFLATKSDTLVLRFGSLRGWYLPPRSQCWYNNEMNGGIPWFMSHCTSCSLLTSTLPLFGSNTITRFPQLPVLGSPFPGFGPLYAAFALVVAINSPRMRQKKSTQSSKEP
jgi:hypothetical protein